MKRFITVFPNGKIKSISSCPDNDLINQPEYPDHLIEINDNLSIDINEYYISEGLIIKIPESPYLYSKFDYDTKEWILDKESCISEIKYNRLLLLESSDWTQLPDISLTTKEAWAVYRQSLRDITKQEGYPFNVVWPIPPE